MGRILIGCLALAMSTPLLAQQINGAEYFFDADPGAGLANPLTVPEGATSSSTHNIDAAALSAGFHRLNVRYHDSNGTWGLVQGRMFFVSDVPLGIPATDIAAAEYFIDTDPGPGEGIAVAVPSGSTSTSAFTVDALALDPGFHKLGVRYMNAQGIWGISQGRSFFVTDPVDVAGPAAAISAAEYFIDTDPGPGAGVAISVPSGNTSNSAFTINALALPTGFHTLNVRYLSENGWGIAVGRLFFMSEPLTGPGPAPSIMAAEYFFDTDPGVTAATPLTITPGNTFTDQVFIDASALPMGDHVLSIRVQDADGSWSIALAETFTVIEPDPVANDECVAAIAISLNPPAQCPSGAVSSTTLGATGGGGIPCQTGTPADVWYSVNSGAAQSVGVTLTSITAGGMGLRVLDGCSGTQLYCGTGAAHAFSVAAPTDLVLQVFTVAEGTFTICVYDATTVLDCMGVLGGAALPGTTCDDANASTIDEVFDESCACVGYDCLGVANGTTGPGSPCLAGTGINGVEFYGVYNAQCECSWTDCNSVPNGPDFLGQACNDGLPGSPTSYLDETCSCVPYDCAGVPNGPLMIGTPCAAGTYPNGAINPVINASCQCTWTDCIGTVNGNQFPGVACNDNNAATSNDVYQPNCVCAGVVLDCTGVVNGPAVAGTPCMLSGEAGTWSGSCVCIIPRPDLTVVGVTAVPSLVTPGDSVEVTWTVNNIGAASSALNWTERIYAQSATGQNTVLLRQIGFVEAGVLANGSGLQHSKKVLVPAQFNAGDLCVFRVDIVPGSGIIEVVGGAANNSGIQSTPWNVAKLLYIVPATVQLTEGGSANLSVRRTGSTASALTVDVALTNASRFSTPTTITIPVGQYTVNLPIPALENALLEGTIVSSLTASAAGFSSAAATITLLDNEQPALSFVGFPTSTLEGNSYTFQVASNLVQSAPLTVTLSSSNTQRFPLPASVVIPQGSSTASITVNLQQDNIPELNISVTVQAGAAGHSPANAAALVADDDVPGLELILNTDTISEAGGINAVSASLRRTAGSSPIAFTANLSASLASTLILPSSLSLAAGQTQVNFNIGVVDNALNDGYRNVTITAALVMPSCGCGAPPTSSGYVTTGLVAVDNDGPALSVTPNPLTLAEGQAPAGQLRVQRNSSTGTALSVSLFSSEIGEATIPATITIPIGSSFVDVPITTINDGVPDGSKIVYFTANASGFSPGIAWAMVTDVNKPDLQITAQVTETTVPVLAGMGYSFTITNSGFATAPSGVLVRGYLSTNTTIDATDVILIEHYLDAPLSAGGSVTIQGVSIIPDLPGTRQLLFMVNPLSAITELLLTNNTAPAITLSIRPAYNAIATVASNNHFRGVPVPITGSAQRVDGSPAPNAQVEIYVITSQGLRREVMATTDASGNFNASFVPLTNEVGHFTVGAAFPDIDATDPQDMFDILGVRVNNGALPQFFFTFGDTLQGTMAIRNLSDAPLPELTIAPVMLPAGAVMTFGIIPLLGANATANLPYTITSSSVSPGTNYQQAEMKVTSTLGDIQPCFINYFCQTPQGYITAAPSSITTTVSTSMGERQVELRVVNIGAGSTGNVSVSLPQVSWLNTITPVSLAPMLPGDTTLIILRFLAHGSVPFNYPINGSIGVNTQNGNNLSIPFSFTKVSESTGEVVVEVLDQNTYFSVGAPMVPDVSVTIKNFYTGVVYAQGLTGADGRFIATNVPEGLHRITAQKAQHQSYNGTIEVNPGASVTKSVFMEFQAVTFNWTVEPTTIDDEYTVTLNTQFQTNVPMPIVTVGMPTLLPHLAAGESYAFNVELTNHGLIAARDVTLQLPLDPEYEFITNYPPTDLAALTTIQVPCIMRPYVDGMQEDIDGLTAGAVSEFLGMDVPQLAASARENVQCQAFTKVIYWYTCDQVTGLWQRGGVLSTFSGRSCSSESNDPTPVPGWPVGTGTDHIGGGGCAVCPGSSQSGEIDGIEPVNVEDEVKSCVECINAIGGALDDCVGVKIPTNLLQGRISASELLGLVPTPPGWKSVAKCAGSAILDFSLWGLAKCVPKLISGPLSCAKSVADLVSTCLSTNVGEEMALDSEMLVNELERDAPGLGAVFAQFHADLSASLDAYDARHEWALLYFGDLASYDAFDDLEPLIAVNIEEGTPFEPAEITAILNAMAGYEIPQSEIQDFLLRWNASIEAWQLGVQAPNAEHPGIIDLTLAQAYSDTMVIGLLYAQGRGFTGIDVLFTDALLNLYYTVEDQSSEVCTAVTVQLSQQVTMTREAFDGTLGIHNGHPTDAMDSLSVDILITDLNGTPSNGLFQINTTLIQHLGNVSGTGQLGADENGTVQYLFIPTNAAAPYTPVQYLFGGSVTYWDPFNEQMATIQLTQIPITVNPGPDLILHYFLERNIISDDPLTADVIEPTIPAELAVMVQNDGYGAATNLTISSTQPQITSNESGLAIDFQLIGSNLQGQPANLGVTNIQFGTVPARQTRIGQWYLTSSLLGYFSDYDAQVVHNNSFGNPELSLVQGAELHELTKSIRAYGSQEDGITDFLVNDFFDPFDVPDVIYFSQGDTVAPVDQATTGSFSAPVGPPSFTNVLSVTPSENGWNYIKLDDPGNGDYKIVSVTREDGQVIPLNNAWLTFVTLPIQQLPLYENKFHFVDRFTSLAEMDYTVTWTPRDTTRLRVDTIIGVPADITAMQVQELTVVFNRAVDPATFTTDDLSLHFEDGPDLMNASATITQVDARTFDIVFGSLTDDNGSFDFVVEGLNVSDTYGRSGVGVDTVSWIQYHSVPAIEAFLGFPSPTIATSYSTFSLLFNLPIDASTVTADRFTLIFGGDTLPAPLTIDSVSLDLRTFYLSGLGALMTADGLYQLVVDMPAIRTTGLAFGIAPQSIALTLDNTGPLVTSLTTSNTGAIDAQHVTFIDINLSEPVVGIPMNALNLTRDGSVLPLSGVALSMISPTHWRLGSLGLGTYNEGAYSFNIATNLLADALGNPGSGPAHLEWNVARTTTLTIASPTISPDMGYSASDKITASLPLNIGFTLNESAQQVRISRVAGGNETTMATVNNVAAGINSIPVILVTGGNVTLKITAVALNTVSTSAQFSLFADEVPLGANWTTTQNQELTTPLTEATLHFSEQLLDEGLIGGAMTLSRDAVPLSTNSLVLDMTSATDLRISGLEDVASETGTYRLRIDLTALAKRSSGAIGATTTELVWTVFPVDQTVKLALKAMLEGPYDPQAERMHDSLRVAGLIPTSDPYPGLGYTYTGGTSTAMVPSLLTVQNDNAIVDWVVVELRDGTDPAEVLYSIPALLQRDGDIIETDGTWPLALNVHIGDYYIAVRHRNHLGVMTASPTELNGSPTLLDLSNPNVDTYGTDALKIANNKALLWCGDVNMDQQIKYTGSVNDRDLILVRIGGTIATNVISDTYSNEDVNMDGSVKYTGAHNDRDPILVNIGGTIATNVKIGQLP